MPNRIMTAQSGRTLSVAIAACRRHISWELHLNLVQLGSEKDDQLLATLVPLCCTTNYASSSRSQQKG